MTLVKNSKRIHVRHEGEADPRATASKVAERVGTPSLIWLLVKRHKMAIMLLGDIVLILNWVFPPWPQIVSGFLTSLF